MGVQLSLSGAWRRWKRFAQRAALVQSNAALWVLYYVAFVPLALGRRLFIRPVRDRRGPVWQTRAETGVDLQRARRQF